MGTLPFPQFPEDEGEDFNAACRKYRARPEDFLIKAEVEPLGVGVQPIRRQIILIHVPTALGRRYEGGHGSHWTIDFENDLASGVFLKA